MTLTQPDFRLDEPNPNPSAITDAQWWLWLRLRELEPKSKLGGILAWKKGFHSTGQYNLDRYPDNYSIRDAPNRSGPWWKTKASALDWTFPDAQGGSYGTIAKYTARVIASGRDSDDPRLGMILYEIYGNADHDTTVEGWDEYHDRSVTSDSSHLWHIHFSFLRNKCGDFWGMWALLTVLMGWTVSQWRATIPSKGVKMIEFAGALPELNHGDNDPDVANNTYYVKRAQALLSVVFSDITIDGDYGPQTTSYVKTYNAKYLNRTVDGRKIDGATWARLLALRVADGS